MTAADHANTGVDIIAVAKKFAPEVVYLRLVELEKERDALQTQVETAEAEVTRLTEERDEANEAYETGYADGTKTAKAENDTWKRVILAALDALQTQVETAEAERDFLLSDPDNASIKEWHDRLKAERDRLAAEVWERVSRTVDVQDKLAEAEAERDRLQAKYDDIRGEYLVLEAERDRLAEQRSVYARKLEADIGNAERARKAERVGRKQAEAERDHARDALRQIERMALLGDGGVITVARSALGEHE